MGCCSPDIEDPLHFPFGGLLSCANGSVLYIALFCGCTSAFSCDLSIELTFLKFEYFMIKAIGNWVSMKGRQDKNFPNEFRHIWFAFCVIFRISTNQSRL